MSQSNMFESIKSNIKDAVTGLTEDGKTQQEEVVKEQVEVTQKPDDVQKEPKVITVFSPKGGAGKTVTAINLAIALSLLNKRVLVVDFDLKAPLDIAKLINISPKHSLVDVISYMDKGPEVLKQRLQQSIVKYSDNLSYIPAISRIRQFTHIKAPLVKPLISTLKEEYDYVVIDGGSELTDVLISLFDSSNLIGMIITPDVLSVYKTEWCLDTLESLQFPLNMIKVIINRAETKGSFSSQEMKLVIPCEIVGLIPSDGKTMNYSLNRQVPAVIDCPDSIFSIAVKNIAASFSQRKDIFVKIQKESRAKGDAGLESSEATFWEKQGLVEPIEAEREEANRQDEIYQLKEKVHKRLIEEMNIGNTSIEAMQKNSAQYKELRQKVERLITNLLVQESGEFISSLEVRQKLIREMVDEALGFGPLEDLIKDHTISEIMVNNRDQVYIEKAGKLILTAKKFVSNNQIRTVIERIIAPLGRRLDESTPMVDARLPDGSRVNAIIPPLALSGPTLTIRKFSHNKLTIQELVDKYGSLTKDMAEFLIATVKSRKNVIVSGGTDSGKTTFLNILSECIPDTERVITIEDAAEIKLHHQHWIRLESRPPNIEGKGQITLRDLFRNTLRMRPDRIVVGEVRGEEVIDMLQAMNTGHDGSMSTVHANSPRDVMTRLDSLMLMSGIDIPLRAIREMIASALDIIVQTAKFPDGTRRVTHVSEVIDVDENSRVILKDIFVYTQTGLGEDNTAIGEFRATGYVPTYIEELNSRGLSISKDLFKEGKIE